MSELETTSSVYTIRYDEDDDEINERALDDEEESSIPLISQSEFSDTPRDLQIIIQERTKYRDLVVEDGPKFVRRD